jgi:hypothetical protein
MRQQAVIATTHLDRQNQRFTKGALEKMAADINNGDRMPVNVEHDWTLPPLGKIVSAKVEERDDGEHQLVVTQEYFTDLEWRYLEDGTRLFRQKSKSDQSPFVIRPTKTADKYTVAYDPNNFEDAGEPESFIREMQEDLSESILQAQFGRKSWIPDPELIVNLAEPIVYYLLGKKMLDRVGDRVGELAADEIEKFYSFVKSLASHSKDYLIPKNRPVTYLFPLGEDPQIELIVRTKAPDTLEAATRIARLEEVVHRARDLDSRFDTTKIQFLYEDKTDTWRLNYMLTETGNVIGTEKSFDRRMKRIEKLGNLPNSDGGAQN